MCAICYKILPVGDYTRRLCLNPRCRVVRCLYHIEDGYGNSDHDTESFYCNGCSQIMNNENQKDVMCYYDGDTTKNEYQQREKRNNSFKQYLVELESIESASKAAKASVAKSAASVAKSAVSMPPSVPASVSSATTSASRSPTNVKKRNDSKTNENNDSHSDMEIASQTTPSLSPPAQLSPSPTIPSYKPPLTKRCQPASIN